jgi:hypothetical protein
LLPKRSRERRATKSRAANGEMSMFALHCPALRSTYHPFIELQERRKVDNYLF